MQQNPSSDLRPPSSVLRSPFSVPPSAFTAPLTGDTAIIACHFNPAGYERPRANLVQFLNSLSDVGFPVFMAEGSLPGHRRILPECDRVIHAEARSKIWLKESLLNLAETIVPPQFTKIAWVDADMIFSSLTWLPQLSTLLDSYQIAQPYSRVQYTDRDGKPTHVKSSAGIGSLRGSPDRGNWAIHQPGGAMAAQRTLFTELGGLYNSTVGQGDSILALGALDRFSSHHPSCQVPRPVYEDYRAYAEKILDWTHGTIGVVLDSTITHLWHGERNNRQYLDRLALLKDFQPKHHLTTPTPEDPLPHWTPEALTRHQEMITNIANYFSSRKEDG